MDRFRKDRIRKPLTALSGKKIDTKNMFPIDLFFFVYIIIGIVGAHCESCCNCQNSLKLTAYCDFKQIILATEWSPNLTPIIYIFTQLNS